MVNRKNAWYLHKLASADRESLDFQQVGR